MEKEAGVENEATVMAVDFEVESEIGGEVEVKIEVVVEVEVKDTVEVGEGTTIVRVAVGSNPPLIITKVVINVLDDLVVKVSMDPLDKFKVVATDSGEGIEGRP